MISLVNKTASLTFFSLVLFFTIGNLPHHAWGEEIPEVSPVLSQDKGPRAGIGEWIVGLYRDHISAVDGDRCPSVPSCSAYAVEVFKKHGFFMGWMMTVDRLIHEGKEEVEVSSPIYFNGGLKIFDPVENNDFWWFTEKRNEKTAP